MQLLPTEQRTFMHPDDQHVIAGAHEHNGARWYTKLRLMDLPNDLVSRDDLVRLGIDLINRGAVAKREASHPFIHSVGAPT
jgi:hypothetical protein